MVVEGTAASFVVELSGESRKTVTVSYKTADGTALAGEDYPAVALTELEFTSGVTAQTISVATTDDGLDEEDGETFTVTLSAPGNAALATGGETATGTINDNDGEPKVSIKGAPVVTEGTAASFVVELSGESRKTVTVSYKTADGTALAGEDYPAVALTELEFTSGVTAQTISVATTDDGLDEEDGETFTVTLSAPGNAALATGGETATGTINDNDGEPKVSIKGAPVVTEGTAASFVVELNGESRKTVTVSYKTADGTALAGEDYPAVALTELEFTSGVTAQTISVATTDDGLDEEDGETFTVTLSAPGNAELATGRETATGKIDDNDGEPKVSITGAPVVVEGTAASFVVELNGESRKTVTVSYKTADGTALAGEDYPAVALTELEFTSGVTAQTISVATTDDGLDEEDGETFTVTLSSPVNAELATGAKKTATGTIDDNDGEPKVSITGTPVVVEGTAASFVVELNGESRKTVTVSYKTADGTALAGEDYPAVALTELEFTSGVTAQTISVATTDDGLDEEDGETFTVTLSSPVNAELATGAKKTATGTIDDNDGEPEVSITGTPVVVEGTAASFVVELNGESRKTVTVSYKTADGTALAGEDYPAVALTELEFTSGVTAQTISVATTDDGLDEEDGETFTVTLSSPVNAELATGAKKTATGTIDDNDDPPEVSITGAPVVVEGTAASFVVELNGESRKTVTVSYKTADGTALAGEDYPAVALTELEFTSGVTAQTISVATTDDGLDEEDGETFTVTLSSPVNAELATGAKKTATGTIDDNDDPPEVSITGAPVVVEGTAASFVVELNGESRKTVTVSYKTADGTALAGEDYPAVALTELEFTSGVTAQTISVATTDDGLDEEDGETFTVTLSSPVNAELATGAKKTATGTIDDNDGEPKVSITGAPVVVEGTAASFVVELSGESRKTVTVSYKTDDGTALAGEDYPAVALTELEFTSGVTAQTISVATTDDGLDEEDGETFTVTLSSPVNAELATGAKKTATGTIDDNDDPPEVSITGAPVVVEGTAASFVVELNGESRKTVTVSYKTADGTALAGEDYPAVALTELEFTSGVTAQTISVATTDDGLDEEDGETFTVTLSSPVNAELATGAKKTATGTINDNDDPPEVSITGAPVVVEGTAASFVVELNGESRKTVTVSYKTADGTALAGEDYPAVALTELEFTSGVTAQTISVATTDDGLDEEDGETFTVTLSSPVNAELATGAKKTATGTINDNDGEPKVSITGTPVVVEGTAASFVVELSGESRKTVTVSYKTADGTALAGEDYPAVALTELEFTSGVTAQTISVATTDDGLDEEDGETFTVTLSSPVNAELATGAKKTATGTINDNDGEPKVSITGAPVVVEGTAASFVVELNGESRKTVTVSYKTADGTALAGEDYPAVALTELEFTSGVTAQTISVATTVDGLDEADGETFTVTLSGPVNAELATGRETATGTIDDNDDEPKVSITGAPVVVEGTAASFVVELSGESRKTVTVSYATADGTALESEDYTKVAATTLEFTSGVTAQTISVATSEDTLNESNETFKVTLSSASNATLDTDDAEATGTIGDNDELTAAVTADSETGAVAEGESTTFTVTLTGGTSTAQVVVDYSLVGSATVLEDYEAPSGKLTIGSSLTSGQITIETLEDDVLDRDETLKVQLDSDSATSAGTVNVSDATAETKITDSSEVTVSVKAAVFVEDDPNTPEDESEDTSTVEEGEAASFAVELSGAVGVRVEVPYETRDGSALEGADKDYTENRGTLTFEPSEISKTIEIATLNDDLIEADETYTVMLTATSLPDGVSVAKASATGTITDNDTLTAAVTADNPTVTEDQSATFTVTLTGGTSTAEVVVEYSLVGTATEEDDYTAPSGKLTIGASDASGQIAIKTLQDNVLDRGETLEIELDSASTDGMENVSAATAETTITDLGTVEVSVTGLTVEEGDPPVTVDKSSVEEGEPASFVVELSGPVEKTVEVSYATSDGSGSDAATAGTDYTAADVTLTFASNETSKTVAVTTTVDAFNEADETFTVTLTGVTLPDGVSLDADATTARGTIENDDALTATVTANAETVPEGNAAEFTVELTGGTSTADVIVNYTWEASTGTAGTDYTEPSGLLTITKPDSSGTIAIATKADDVLDPGETLSVTLTAATTAIGTATLGTPKTATTTIAEKGTVIVSVRKDEVPDDDTTQNVNEYQDKSIVEEGEAASFVVELSGAVASAVEVAYATSNGTGAGHAVAGTDYAVTNGTLTFNSGESLTQTITVPTTDHDDDLNEPTEIFTVTLPDQTLPYRVSKGTSSVQGTITDNDGLVAAVTALATSVDEGSTAEFEVELTGGTSTAAVIVTYTVGGTASGDDYTAPTDLTLTIATGVATGTISIETLTDTVVERDDETLEITLTGAATSTRTVAIDADKTTVTTTINNTTTASPSLRPPKDATSSTASRTALATRSAAVQQTEWTVTASTRANSSPCLIGEEVPCPMEGNPVTIPVYLVTTNEKGETVSATLQDTDMVKMPYVTSNDTADAGDDYTSKSGTLTFTSTSDQSPSPCETGALCLPLTLETIDDNLNEDREAFTLTLEEAELPDTTKTNEAPYAVPILDNDPITASVKASTASVIEGQPVSFTVTLSGGETTADVTIRYSVSGTATRDDDYRAPSGTVTIARDSTSRRFTVRIQTIDDLVVETEETLVLQLSGGSSAGSVRASGSDTVTILDNDTVMVSVESATTTEGEPASFVVKLSRQAPGSLEVSYETADVAGTGAAEAGTDYTAASGTLTFAPGDTSKTVAVPTLDDELNEADETFTLTLSAPNLPNWATLGTDGTANATGTIEDDDMLAVAVTADADIVAEGDPATFTVTLTGGTSTGDVVVVYTVDGSATASDDYTAPDGTLTIGMGETSGTITIATRADDVMESDETLEVTLDMAESVGEVEVDPTPAMTTIIDPPAVTIGNANAAESDGEIVFEVELSASSTRQITVEYRTVDGTATEPEDYVKASGSLTFAAGQTSGSITIRVVDDPLDEADRETFTVRLSDPKYGRLGDTGITATGTIIDDDDPPAISVHDASAKESAGEIAFRVSLDAPSGRRVAVKYRTEEGTAKPGEDYGDTDGTVTLEAGQTAATIRVRLLNDTLEEPDETFTVRLMELENELTHAELADPTATGTIIDDDVSVAQVWLARFGRTVATHVVDAVGERLNEAAGRSSEAAIAGHPLQPAPVPAEWQESTPIPFRTLAGHDLVAGSSFRLASSGDEDEAAGGGSKWTGWGRGAVTRLAGKEPKADLLLRGTIATGTAGVDYDWGGVLTGLAMAYTGGGGNFKTDEPYLEPRSGTAESWLLSAHPYARVSVVDGLEVWGLLGYGLGMMTLTEDASVNTDIRLMMGAAGVRGILLTPMANGGFGVAVSSDGFAMRANGDAAGHQPAVEADAVRGRLLVEGSYDAQLGDGSVLIPMVEAGMRYDAGHAEEGFGAELGGGVRYVKPEWGLTATANGRFVLAHQDRGFQEWGLRGSLQWSPGAGGLGPSLGVNTSVGTAASGVQRLWSQGATPIPAAPESDAPAGRLDAQLGYGMSVDLLGTNARLTPYAGLTLADGGTQAYRVGGRANLGPAFSLSLQGERRERSGAAPAHGITLSGSLRW